MTEAQFDREWWALLKLAIVSRRPHRRLYAALDRLRGLTSPAEQRELARRLAREREVGR